MLIDLLKRAYIFNNLLPGAAWFQDLYFDSQFLFKVPLLCDLSPKGKNNTNSALTTCGVAVNAVTIRIVASVTITDARNGLAVLDHNERQKTRRWPPFANAIV